MLARPGPVGLAWEECWMVHDWLPAHGAIMVAAGRPRRLDWDARHAADPLTQTDQPKVSNTPVASESNEHQVRKSRAAVSHAKHPRQQRLAGVGGRLREDRLEVVLDGVLRQDHGASDLLGVVALDQVAQQL